jgi:ADP-heptose:LPS heptosyltransferase
MSSGGKMNKTALIDLNKYKSLMFVRLGKLGDMMVAGWMFKQVKKKYPHLRLGLLTLPRSRELFKYNSDIDVLKTWNPAALPLLALSERMRGWDVLMDLNDDASRRSLLALKIINPKQSFAFLNKKSEGAFEHTIKSIPKDRSHVLERLQIFANSIGIKSSKKELRAVVYLKAETLEQTLLRQKELAGKNAKIITLNLSAGHSSRYWETEKWEKLANKLLSVNKNIWIKILYSSKDVKMFRMLTSNLKNNRILAAPPGSLNNFLTAIAASDLLVSPDTSAVHAACALNVPVVGLYPEAEWNIASWRPFGVKNIVVRSADKNGIASIPYDMVEKAVLKMLNGR